MAEQASKSHMFVEHAGKSYHVQPRKLTPAVMDAAEPIMQRMREYSGQSEVAAAVSTDPAILELVELRKQTVKDDDGNEHVVQSWQMRQGLDGEAIKNIMRANPSVARAIMAPTLRLVNDRPGRALAAELFRVGVDRTGWPQELSNAVDAADHYTNDEQDTPPFWANVDLVMLREFVVYFRELVGS